MLSSLAPILPHLAEDAWQNLPESYTNSLPSVFLAGWQTPDSQWNSISEENINTANSLKLIRDHVNTVSILGQAKAKLSQAIDTYHYYILFLDWPIFCCTNFCYIANLGHKLFRLSSEINNMLCTFLGQFWERLKQTEFPSATYK